MKKASVQWLGKPNSRTRIISTQSGILNRTNVSNGYSPDENFHTDPVELVATAHASSFLLALSNELGSHNGGTGRIDTATTVTMECLPAGWTIMNIHLNVVAKLPKVTQSGFIDATVRAKTKCLISRLLRANISMNAKLEN
jgi:osmotically inducible protein OsmC